MKARLLIALLVLFAVGIYIYHAYRPARQFDHLERNARKVITAGELQTWATNLLAMYPTNSELRLSQLGTNFPEQLRSLAPKLGPLVWIHDGDSTTSPRWVRVYWGSGFLGAHGFEIGPTNFVSLRPGRAWAPGVYFYDH